MTTSYRKPEKRPTTRRNRRLQIAAAGAVSRPPLLGVLWNVSRPKTTAAVLSLLLLGALFLAFDTDFFYIYQMEISGTLYLKPAEIERSSGILGYNIFFVDTRSVEQALSKMPGVKSVHVSASIPNQVRIDIEERKPEITWIRGRDMYWVDSSGIGFPARQNLVELPVIRDLDQVQVKPGQRLASDAVAAFWAYRSAYPEGSRSLEWSTARGLAFTDEHGWKIFLGGAEEMPGKIAKLRALIPQLVQQNVKLKFIDLGKGDPYLQ